MYNDALKKLPDTVENTFNANRKKRGFQKKAPEYISFDQTNQTASDRSVLYQ